MELFSKQAVTIYNQIWDKVQKGEELMGDAELIADEMKRHPEFDPFWNQGEAAFQPQEINGYIVNPLVHTGLHVAVEKQLFNDDPEEVSVVFKALLEKGTPRHEVIHQIAGLWGNLYFKSVRRGGPLEESVYIEELKAMLDR